MKKMVGEHIREIRKSLGYKTIDAWAEALQVHPNTVGEVERGANWVSPELLEKMISVTGFGASNFFPPSASKAAPRLARSDENELLSKFEALFRAVRKNPLILDELLAVASAVDEE